MTRRASAARRLASLRLAAQRLGAAPLGDVASVARWMTAMQAQDFPGACWSLGLRAAGATEATVREALGSGAVVRSWPMRGTLHFVPGEDLGWVLSLTAERTLRGAAARRAALDLDDAQLGRARDTAAAALSGGKRRTREQMMQLFEQAGLSTAGQRGYHLLWHLAHVGLLCFGPPEGPEQTLVLLDEWVPRPRKPGRDEALAELATRYFSAHGPATLHDFAWWTSLTMKDARLGASAAGRALASLEADGASYLLSPALLDAPEPAPSALLLPGFDEFMLGYQDRSAALPAEHAQRIVPGNNGMFLPTLVVDGQVVGTWKRTLRARRVALEARPFVALPARVKSALGEAAGHLGRYLGLTPELAFVDP